MPTTGDTLPERMRAFLLTRHGGFEALALRDDVPVPRPAVGDVLVAVGACGLNNTDVNTRIGWYASGVTGPTADGAAPGPEATEDAGWAGTLAFPRIQGADVAGRIVAAGSGVSQTRIGERVLVDPWLRPADDPDDRTRAGFLGSERDGGFAEYVAVPAANAFPIETSLPDAELATFPCAYSTAEHMLSRVRVAAGERVLITGASGGVGSAAVQLAHRRGARVLAVAGGEKTEAVRALGAEAVIRRDIDDLVETVRALAGGVEVVADMVGGAAFPSLLDVLVPGGRYVTSGAIAGPIVALDLRVLYLKDLEFQGATVVPRTIFPRLVRYIARGEVRPLLAASFPLERLIEAQKTFLAKHHVGNLVVLPGSADTSA